MRIDYDDCRRVLEQALVYIQDGHPLPEEWVHRVRATEAIPSKTFIAMLGTALIARATDPRVDPTVLKATADPAPGFIAFSARGVATGALAPLAVEFALDIGTRGREPLNNQPFFHNLTVHRGMTVHTRVRPHLDDFVSTLERLRELPEEDLIPALAAFVALRRRSARRPTRRVEISGSVWTTADLIEATSDFVTSYPEEGRRGQALVASVLDLVFDNVRVGHINDPGRTVPGDVYAGPGDGDPNISIEVKQKPVSASDILSWAASVAKAGLRRGMYVLLAPTQAELDIQAITLETLNVHGVSTRIIPGPRSLMQEAMIYSRFDVNGFMTEFPTKMLERLEEVGVASESLHEWETLFG